MRKFKMVSRRDILAGATGTALAALAEHRALGFAPVAPRGETVSIAERHVEIEGGSLYLREADGGGEAVLLAHPVTGSAHVWDQHLTALSSHGYHAIAWSRRGHRGSSRAPDGGADAETDLLALADALGLARFHAVGSAAGGGVVLGFASVNPGRLLSLTVACSGTNIADPQLNAAARALMPAPFSSLPAEVRELGPDYRFANPEGVAQWKKMEEMSRPDAGPLGPPPAPKVCLQSLRRLTMPALWIAGAADLFAPPSLLRRIADHVPGSQFAIIASAGHSAYWECPEQFENILAAFLSRSSRMRTTEENPRPWTCQA